MAEKLKVAFHWLASCGGCEVAVVDLDEKILDVIKVLDILFWPVALDGKYEDIKAMPDKYLDIAIINGAVRTTEQEEHAKLFRAKAKVVVSFGSCACFGGVPALANLTTKEKILQTAYETTVSTDNPKKTRPQLETKMNGRTLELPDLYESVKALHQVIDVDYFLPGCPPMVPLIEKLVAVAANFAETGELPPKGAVIAGEKTLCDECPLERKEKMVAGIERPHTFAPPDPERCLLEQGLICMGPATRDGCDSQCIKANMPCRGCMGPPPKVDDQGLKMLSALASIMGVENETEMSRQDLEEFMKTVPDPWGTFYRFGMSTATLNKSLEGEKRETEEK